MSYQVFSSWFNKPQKLLWYFANTKVRNKENSRTRNLLHYLLNLLDFLSFKFLKKTNSLKKKFQKYPKCFHRRLISTFQYIKHLTYKEQRTWQMLLYLEISQLSSVATIMIEWVEHCYSTKEISQLSACKDFFISLTLILKAMEQASLHL